MTDISGSTRPATPLDTLPAAAQGPGRRGFISPSGVTIVVQLDRHDMVAEGSPDHIGIGVTAWEIDTSGSIVGEPTSRWVHTAPMSVIGSGNTTLSAITAICEDEAVQKILNKKAVMQELDSLDLASTPDIQ